jgi:hypothetical protein
MTVYFSESCEKVIAVIKGRVAGQSTGAWHDPHNNGKYTIDHNSTQEIDLHRLTGKQGQPTYTDKMTFTFETHSDSDYGCKVDACSDSQVLSVTDFNTNYCNLHDLYCFDKECHGEESKKLHFKEELLNCVLHTKEDCYRV